MSPALQESNPFNNWADWWRNKVGANVIPQDSLTRVPFVKWGEWTGKPIPQSLHDEWKTKRMFDKGLALILGRAWHLKGKELYLVCLDADNKAAVDWILGNQNIPAGQTAHETRGALEKLHCYFYTVAQMENYKYSQGDPIEIECKARDCLITCAPSKHKSGNFFNVAGKFGILDHKAIIMPTPGETKKTRKFVIPCEEITEGNRNDKYFNVCVSYMKKFPKNEPFDEDLAWLYLRNYNLKYCKPPLEEREARGSFESSLNYRPDPAAPSNSPKTTKGHFD